MQTRQLSKGGPISQFGHGSLTHPLSLLREKAQWLDHRPPPGLLTFSLHVRNTLGFRAAWQQQQLQKYTEQVCKHASVRPQGEPKLHVGEHCLHWPRKPEACLVKHWNPQLKVLKNRSYLFKTVILLPLDKHPEVGLLDDTVVLLIFFLFDCL